MDILEITQLEVSPFASNCYLIKNATTEQGIIIDPGDEPELIKRTIQEKNVNPKQILLTHGHLDHIMAVTILSNEYDLPVYAHAAEELLLQNVPAQAQMFGLPPVEIPIVTDWFDDGDILDLIGLEIKVLHTPGHSPGGSCFQIGKTIFVGDTLFQSSIGRTDLPGGDYQQLINSIKTKLFTLDDDMKVYPGHGDSTTIGLERQFNPFLQ